MNQARPPSQPRSASGIRSLPGSKIIWAKRWEVCVLALRGEGGGAGRAGCAGRGEVPSDSPAVVRTELTLLSFPLTAASTARKLNPLAAWRGRGTSSALTRAPPGWGPVCTFETGHCGLAGSALAPQTVTPTRTFLTAFSPGLFFISSFYFLQVWQCQHYGLSFPI